jgi:hypothetical protein
MVPPAPELIFITGFDLLSRGSENTKIIVEDETPLGITDGLIEIETFGATVSITAKFKAEKPDAKIPVLPERSLKVPVKLKAVDPEKLLLAVKVTSQVLLVEQERALNLPALLLAKKLLKVSPLLASTAEIFSEKFKVILVEGFGIVSGPIEEALHEFKVGGVLS